MALKNHIQNQLARDDIYQTLDKFRILTIAENSGYNSIGCKHRNSIKNIKDKLNEVFTIFVIPNPKSQPYQLLAEYSLARISKSIKVPDTPVQKQEYEELKKIIFKNFEKVKNLKDGQMKYKILTTLKATPPHHFLEIPSIIKIWKLIKNDNLHKNLGPLNESSFEFIHLLDTSPSDCVDGIKNSRNESGTLGRLSQLLPHFNIILAPEEADNERFLTYSTEFISKISNFTLITFDVNHRIFKSNLGKLVQDQLKDKQQGEYSLRNKKLPDNFQLVITNFDNAQSQNIDYLVELYSSMSCCGDHNRVFTLGTRDVSRILKESCEMAGQLTCSYPEMNFSNEEALESFCYMPESLKSKSNLFEMLEKTQDSKIRKIYDDLKFGRSKQDFSRVEKLKKV